MNEKEEIKPEAERNFKQDSSPDSSTQAETPNRRELIERYGKYALVAAPLLLFASKARAIHSVP